MYGGRSPGGTVPVLGGVMMKRRQAGGSGTRLLGQTRTKAQTGKQEKKSHRRPIRTDFVV